MNKKFIGSLIFLFLFCLTGFVSYYYIDISSDDQKTLISPVSATMQSVGLNQWFPQNVLGVQVNAPTITATAALFLDSKTGEILYEKNVYQQLPIASLTKVMTILVAREHKNLNDTYTISERAAAMEPDKMFLKTGEQLTLEELLYGIFLVSANDAAEVLAEGTISNRTEFIILMNAKARQLGMNNTHFVNPTGLDEDLGNSYSSAYDLVLLTRYAIRRFPELVKISQVDHIYLPITENHQDYDMYSGINLLTTYPGVVGFKTGYTPDAGLTLITLARKDNKEVIGVLLGTENRREEARELLDYSFRKIGIDTNN